MTHPQIVLLRGINVGGHKKIRMKDLAVQLKNMGLTNVQTYIQSGNLVVHTQESRPTTLSEQISTCIRQRFSMEVEAITRTLPEFRRVIEHNPFLSNPDIDPTKIHVTFLQHIPTPEVAQSFTNIHFPPDEFVWREGEIFVFCPNGYGRTKLENGLFERHLRIKATTRNLNTIRKLITLAASF